MATSVVRDRQTQRNGEDRETLSPVRPEDYEERGDPSVHDRIVQLAYSHWQSRGCRLVRRKKIGFR
jgi:hypothetical protein